MTVWTTDELDEWAPESADAQEQVIEDTATPEGWDKIESDWQVWYVAVYAVNRNYGGPEEGGWWWDSGELIDIRTVEGRREDAWAMRDTLRETYPYTKNRYSVLGGDDYDILVRDELPKPHFPEEVPHYE